MATSYQRRDYKAHKVVSPGGATWWQIGLAVLAAFGVLTFGAISSPANDYLFKTGHARVSTTSLATPPASLSNLSQPAVTPTAQPGVQGPIPARSMPSSQNNLAPTAGGGASSEEHPVAGSVKVPGAVGPSSPAEMESGARR